MFQNSSVGMGLASIRPRSHVGSRMEASPIPTDARPEELHNGNQEAYSRLLLGIRPIIVRALGAVIALTLGMVGPLWGNVASLGAAAALVIILLAIEQVLERGQHPQDAQ